jgi:RNA-directed DNA polymerase
MLRSKFLADYAEEDARRFLNELTDRLAKFDLELEPTKTRLIRFGDQARAQCKHDDCR